MTNVIGAPYSNRDVPKLKCTKTIVNHIVFLNIEFPNKTRLLTADYSYMGFSSQKLDLARKMEMESHYLYSRSCSSHLTTEMASLLQ